MRPMRAHPIHPRHGVLRTLLGLLAPLVLLACTSTGTPPPPSPASGGAEETVAHITLLHLNDVYEITPLEGGRVGGLARVATLRRELLDANPHTLTVLAGDFLSPSAMGTAEVDGARLDGRQMVAVLDAVGLDVATLGNHEFDVDREVLTERLAMAGFEVVTGNVRWSDGKRLPGTLPHLVVTTGEPPVRIGLLGATLIEGAADYVTIDDPVETVRTQAAELDPEVDLLVALTHLELARDIEVATEVEAIDLVLGGHEHENFQLWRGAGPTPILKADANVRTVYVVELRYDTATGRLDISPRLVPITDALAEEPATAAEVARWRDEAFDAFRRQGFEPEAVVATVPVALDGREASIRDHPTALTELLAEAVLAAAPQATLSLLNSGAVRIDDVVAPGPLTQYDVLRILPFGGEVVEVEMAGGLLGKVLDQGIDNRGSGGFLVHAGLRRRDDGSWQVGGEALSEARTYRVALNDFLLSGKERGLGELVPGHPDLQLLGSHGDLRQAVIRELARRYGPAGH